MYTRGTIDHRLGDEVIVRAITVAQHKIYETKSTSQFDDNALSKASECRVPCR